MSDDEQDGANWPEISPAEFKERAQRLARERLKSLLRKHAANVIRVVRGAGSAHDFVREFADLLEIYDEYREAFGTYPPAWEVHSFLDIDDRHRGSEMDEAMHTITRGALQLAASKLLQQKMHISTAKTEILDGIRFRDDYIRRRDAKPTKGKKSPWSDIEL